MRDVTITHPEAATPAEAAATLARVCPDPGTYLVKAADGGVREVTFEGEIATAPDPLAVFHSVFPRPGRYFVKAGSVALTKPFAEWFLEQLVTDARQHFAKTRAAVLQVMERLVRERAGQLTDPVVLAEFEHALHLLRQSVRFSVGAPVDPALERTLRDLGLADVGVLDWPGLAYRLGAVGDELADVTNWERVLAIATRGVFSDTDLAAMAHAREHAARYLTPVVLRDPEALRDGALVHEQRALRSMTRHAIALEMHPKEFARELYHRFHPEGIQRDWERVARTEIQTARLRGAFEAARRREGWGPETLLYKRLSATPCNGCLKVWKNPDGTPRLYTLAEIEQHEALGPNRGPWREWGPRIGPLHPNCMDSPLKRYSPALAALFQDEAKRVWAAVMAARGLA